MKASEHPTAIPTMAPTERSLWTTVGGASGVAVAVTLAVEEALAVVRVESVWWEVVVVRESELSDVVMVVIEVNVLVASFTVLVMTMVSDVTVSPPAGGLSSTGQ